LVNHDPRREVEKLRDTLAAHDKPIAFLFGAGSSCVKGTDDEALVPPIGPLRDMCHRESGALGSEFEESFLAVESELRLVTASPNIEMILSSVRRKIAAMAAADTLAAGSLPTLVAVEEVIRRTIAGAAIPDPARIPTALPHHAFSRWVGRLDRSYPVEVFTGNYDTLLERALEETRIPVFDGFVGSRRPFFMPSSLAHDEAAPGRQWTRLWKIHGSVNWALETFANGERRIVRGDERSDGEVILPSYEKYEQSRKQPYVAILDRLARVLTARDESVLITVGYSWGDQHVNEVLFDALEGRPRMHVFALQHSDPVPGSDLHDEAVRHANLIVLGPSAGIIGGVRGSWKLTDPVDDRTAALLDVPFDSDAVPDPAEPALTGVLRLGKFEWFGRFLDQVAGTSA
jgi:hypothetical protein